MKYRLYLGCVVRHGDEPDSYVVRLINAASTIGPVRNMVYQCLASHPTARVAVFKWDAVCGLRRIWQSIFGDAPEPSFEQIGDLDAQMEYLVIECLRAAYPSAFAEVHVKIVS